MISIEDGISTNSPHKETTSALFNLHMTEQFTEYIANQIYQKTMEKLENEPKMKTFLSNTQRGSLVEDGIKHSFSSVNFTNSKADPK